jgi:hypothetical protein
MRISISSRNRDRSSASKPTSVMLNFAIKPRTTFRRNSADSRLDILMIDFAIDPRDELLNGPLRVSAQRENMLVHLADEIGISGFGHNAGLDLSAAVISTTPALSTGRIKGL